MPYETTCPNPDCQKTVKNLEAPPEPFKPYKITCTSCEKDFILVANERTKNMFDREEQYKEKNFSIGCKLSEDFAAIVGRKSGAQLIEPYDQDDLIGKYSDGDPDAKGGICFGQCLHWMRRVLLGGTETYGQRKEKQKHLRGVFAYKELQTEATDAGEKGPAAWKTRAEMADQKLGTKHKFSSIVLAKCVNEKPYQDGVKAFTVALLGDAEFTNGCCAVIAVGIRNNVSKGHAVALHYGQYKLFLFDPNVGIFMCENKNIAIQALITMVEGWPAENDWELNSSFGYSLFTPEGGGIRHRRKVVQYTPSTGATELQNNTLLPASTSASGSSIDSGFAALRNRNRKRK